MIAHAGAGGHQATIFVYINDATNSLPLPIEQDQNWLNAKIRALNLRRENAEADWKAWQAWLEEWKLLGDELARRRFDSETFFRPPKKLGHGREPKKWDHLRPQRTTRARKRRPRRQRR